MKCLPEISRALQVNLPHMVSVVYNGCSTVFVCCLLIVFVIVCVGVRW